MNELTNRILALQPNAKFCITNIENQTNVDDGQSLVIIRSGLLVIWNVTNTQSPPTQNQIDLVIL